MIWIFHPGEEKEVAQEPVIHRVKELGLKCGEMNGLLVVRDPNGYLDDYGKRYAFRRCSRTMLRLVKEGLL